MNILKYSLLPIVGLVTYFSIAYLSQSPKYVVSLEFKETKKLIQMSDSTFNTYDECVSSPDYKLFKTVGDISGSKYICTNSKTNY